MITIAQTSALRRKLVQLRYTPLPLFGKVPAIERWQQVTNVSHEMIVMWAKSWPDATNTGILTRLTPALDLDIVSEAAAIACEDYVRERFEEKGWFLVRIGKAPKRAILFRTDAPFRKITAPLISPHDSAEKIEFLASGQQIAVHGIHPQTKQPYRWFGGEPWRIERGELPYIHEFEAQQLIVDVTHILVSEFGYRRSGPAANGGIPKASNTAGWAPVIDNILHGRSLHDSINRLASMLVASGMNSGAAVHLIAALLEQADIPHDQRWESRYRDIPRAIDSANRKFR
jgi:uncharacterized protein YoaH (UPF0181 family)